MHQAAQGKLEELLDREIEAARSLADTLAAERAALIGDSPAAVHARAADKLRLLATLETLERERRAVWAAPDPAAPESGSPDLAASPGLAASVAARWRALLELVAGCRTANEVNGHIIHVRQNQIGQLLDIVRGGPAVTYGPQGKTFARALRALARA